MSIWLMVFYEMLKNFPEFAKLVREIKDDIHKAGVEAKKTVKVKDVLHNLREVQKTVALKKLEEITDEDDNALNDRMHGRK